METIYIHTRFLDTQKCFLFFLEGGEFSNIDFYCVKHDTSTGVNLLPCTAKDGSYLFDIQYLFHTLKENYM